MSRSSLYDSALEVAIIGVYKHAMVRSLDVNCISKRQTDFLRSLCLLLAHQNMCCICLVDASFTRIPAFSRAAEIASKVVETVYSIDVAHGET